MSRADNSAPRSACSSSGVIPLLSIRWWRLDISILTDLGNAVGILGLLKGSGQRAEHVRGLNYAANFFKHADKDPDGRVNIEPLTKLTAEFLMDAVVLLQRLTGELPIEGKDIWT